MGGYPLPSLARPSLLHRLNRKDSKIFVHPLGTLICRCREVTYCAGITKGNVTRFVASACDGIAPAQGRPLPGKPRSPRSWRVSILRQRAHYLGTVQAPDERAAEAAAVAWHLR